MYTEINSATDSKESDVEQVSERKQDEPYGWSLLGISRRAGKACSYFSTTGRIWSATCREARDQLELREDGSERSSSAHVLVDQYDGDILPFCVLCEC